MCPAGPEARSPHKAARHDGRTPPGCAIRPDQPGSRRSPATSGTFPAAWPTATDEAPSRNGGTPPPSRAGARRPTGRTARRLRWQRQRSRSCIVPLVKWAGLLVGRALRPKPADRFRNGGGGPWSRRGCCRARGTVRAWPGGCTATAVARPGRPARHGAAAQSERTAGSTPPHAQAHEPEWPEIITGEPGDLVHPVQGPGPCPQGQVATTPVAERSERVVVLDHERAAVHLRGCWHRLPGEVEVGGTHHVDSSGVAEEPELRAEPRVEVQQFVLAV